MNSIPSGKKLSNASNSSCVPPRSPLIKRTFILGWIPIVLAQILKVPFGVSMDMIFIPPVFIPVSISVW
jgi:hypothetical protein